jgi:hypothetical protein
MTVIEHLQDTSGDAASLQNYLSGSFQEVYDFFTQQKHADLVASREVLNKYVRLNTKVIGQLRIDNTTSLAFISLLMDICEELNLIGSFRFLYDHLNSKDFNIGERLRAASLYLIGVHTADDYIDRYERIYGHLTLSAETEEDSADRVLMTMVNYYAQVIYNCGEFNIETVFRLRAKIEESLSCSDYSFLRSKLIEDVLNIDLELVSFGDAYLRIHMLLDGFLGRDIAEPVYQNNFLLEAGTEYCDLLDGVHNCFSAVRQVSVRKYGCIKDDAIFHSLGRGVAVLTDDRQLYAYMYSYGEMHYHKLIGAFSTLPKDVFERETNIIDWGCGQALASMAYFDFLSQIGTQQKIGSLTLIEPSEIALKRAALHVKVFSPTTWINTINRDVDALVSEDLIKTSTNTYLHLFSSILDVDGFSLTGLLQLVEVNFAGDNYFVCSSPYINDTRTSKLDAFMEFFSKKKNFEIIDSTDCLRGQWIHNWTRVVRVFKATL